MLQFYEVLPTAAQLPRDGLELPIFTFTTSTKGLDFLGQSAEFY